MRQLKYNGSPGTHPEVVRNPQRSQPSIAKEDGRLKIGIVTSSFPRYSGDYFGSYTYDLVKNLSSRHEEHVVYLMYPIPVAAAASPAEPFQKHPVRYSYKTYPLSQTKGINIISYTPLFFRILMTVRSVIKKYKLDIIHAHSAIPAGFFAVLCAGKIPVVITLEGSDIMRFGHRWWARPLVRFAMRKAARIIAVSVDIKEKAIKLGAANGKIVVMPDGIDMRRFKPSPQKEARSVLNLPDKFTVLFVGSLYPLKRVDRLIHACAELNRDPRYNVIVAGDGPERPRLERMVRYHGLTNFIFKGRVDGEVIPLYMAAADVLVLPSESEALPTSVQEALACGLPVIATRIGGLPDLITPEKNGYLVDDEAGLAACLEKVMKSPQSLSAMSREALAFAREHLSITYIAERIEAIYWEAIEQRREKAA